MNYDLSLIRARLQKEATLRTEGYRYEYHPGLALGVGGVFVKKAWGNAALRIVGSLLKKKAPQLLNGMRSGGISAVRSTPALSGLRQGGTSTIPKATPEGLLQRILERNPAASAEKLKVYKQRMLSNSRSGMSSGARSALDDTISVTSDPNSIARVGHLGNRGVAYGEALQSQPQALSSWQQAKAALRKAGLPVPSDHGVLAEYGFPSSRMNIVTTPHLANAGLSRAWQARPTNLTRILHPGDRVSQEMLQANSKPWMFGKNPFHEHVLFKDTMKEPFTRARAFVPVRGGSGSMTPGDIAKTADGVKLYKGVNGKTADETWDMLQSPLNRVQTDYWTSSLPSVGARFAAGPEAKLLFGQIPFNEAARKSYTTYFDKLTGILDRLNAPKVESSDLRTFGL